MNNKRKSTGPEKHKEFFEEIAKVFQKYPGMNDEYSISSKTLLKRLIEQKGDSHIITQRWEDNKIVISHSSKSESLSADGCCQWCVDPEGNMYCCISGPDC